MARNNKLYPSDNPDPENYIIVHSKEGDFLRKKRKSSLINASFIANKAETCSAAAKQILQKLQPFTQGLSGRMNVRISGKMRTPKRLSGIYNYSEMHGFDMQKFHPLDHLYSGHYVTKIENGIVTLEVPVFQGCVQRHNGIVTAFYFEAVLLSGDAMIDGGLRVEDDRTAYIPFADKSKKTYNFSFDISSATQYLLFLKVGCLEGKDMAVHPKHYGMRVVMAG